MNIRELRKQKYWSQDQLAQMSGLSIRTIQRIEHDQKAGLESLKALSAVFDIEISELQREAVDAVGIITAEQSDKVKKEAYAEDVMGLYKLMAVAVFSLVPTFIFALNDTIEWGFIGLIAALLIANPSTRPHRQLAPANLKHYWYVPTSGGLAPIDQLKSPISEPLYFEIV